MELNFNVNFWIKLLENPAVLTIGLFLLLLVFILAAFFIFRSFVWKGYAKKQAFEAVLLLILLPQMSAEQKAGAGGGSDLTVQQLQEKIAVMETFLTSLAGLKAEKGTKTWMRGFSEIFSFELVAHKGKISFYVSCPKKYQDLVEDQISAQFPSAVIEPVVDYNIFSPKAIINGKVLKFKREFFFPIKTYKHSESDPINSIINSLGQVDDNDGVAIQIVFRSAPKSWHDRGSEVASNMQQGKSFDDAVKEVGGGGGFLGSLGNELGNFWRAIFSGESKTNELGGGEKLHQLTPSEQEIVKGLEEKTSKAGVEATIRVIAASENQAKAEAYISNIGNAFSQFNIYQYGNAFEYSDQKLKHLMDDFIYRNIDEKKKVVLNTEELSSLFHFPLPSITTHPKINWLEARQSAAPLDLPKEGVIIGENVYRGVKRTIRIARTDRQRHMYIIGKSGSGKSYLMTNMIIQDIMNGDGVCVMDPHGDLANDILKFVPKERAEDVIYFDPSDVERPMGLNLLEFEKEEQKTFVINELINIFDKLYDMKATGGPMFEQYFRNAVQLLMEDVESGSTLLEVPKVLADEDYRAYKLSKTKNPTVKDFWEKEAQKAGGEASLANMVPYITSKLTQFISNDYMRPIISQQKSAFSFRKAMDEKKIILCNLAKGKIGDLNSDLLGMVIVGKILGAALSRVDTPEEQRHDFYLYIDEFQNYLTEGIAIILSEARKYRLCLNIAHQFIGQLVKNNDTRIRDSIFGNVGTIVAYRVGVDDAELFAKQFSPVFSEYDVMNIPRYETYVKLLVNNQNPPAFSMKSITREPAAHPEIAESLIELSRLKYGKDRDIIEAEVRERSDVDY